MSIKKCVHVLMLADWQASIADLVVPLFTSYAVKIGADLNLITQRRFPDWPVQFEKHQIFEAGKSYDWNIHFNLNTLIHPGLGDLTEAQPASEVGNWWYRDVRAFLHVGGFPVFERDGRFYGVDDALLVTSQATHHLWEPLPLTYDVVKAGFKIPDPSLITLLSLSYNYARFGYTSSGVLRGGNAALVANLSPEPNDTRPLRERFLAQMDAWGIVPPTIQGYQKQEPASVSLVLTNISHGESLAQYMDQVMGVRASALSGTNQATLESISSLKWSDVLLLAVPPNAPCDEATIAFIREALARTRHLNRGRALVTNPRSGMDRTSRSLARRWGMKMTELAAAHDVALIDLDVFTAQIGGGNVFKESGGFQDSWASLIAGHVIRLVNHKSFSNRV